LPYYRLTVASQLRAVVTEVLQEPARADGPQIASPEAAATRRRTDGCNAARAALQDARDARGLWETLLLIAGVAILITFAFLIVSLTDLDTSADKIKAALGVAGTAASGTLTGWLVKRRNEAKAEVREWADLINERCE
jgi:hypothetical protein